MNIKKLEQRFEVVGWDVDTQRDFMEDGSQGMGYVGHLAIQDAMSIEQNLKVLTKWLRDQDIQIMGSVDWHNSDSKEFPKKGEEPDFVKTFPPHCIKESYGAEKIDATKPINPLYIDHDEPNHPNYIVNQAILHPGEIYFRKDHFDVFDEEGNEHTGKVLEKLGVKKAIVYGVALEVCNNYAVNGLLERGVEVYAVRDAMRAINEDVREEILEQWSKKGAKIISIDELVSGQVL